MSLREIVRRFVRRESLPVLREGFYESRFGDLEKLSKADIFEQFQKVEELKAQIKGFNDREKARVAKDASKEVGEPLVKNPGTGHVS